MWWEGSIVDVLVSRCIFVILSILIEIYIRLQNYDSFVLCNINFVWRVCASIARQKVSMPECYTIVF